MASNIGTGATLTFSASTVTWYLTNISWSGVSRPKIKTSHLGTTTWDTATHGDLTDPGDLAVEGWLDLENIDCIPITATAAETVTLTFPGTSTSSWAASGFFTDYELGTPLEELCTFSATIGFSGAITRTDAV